MPAQLRDYRIEPGELSHFIGLWKEYVVPLREQAGFRIDRAWAAEGEDRFLWVVVHDGADIEAADRAYHASHERRTLDRDPAALVLTSTKSLLARIHPANEINEI